MRIDSYHNRIVVMKRTRLNFKRYSLWKGCILCYNYHSINLVQFCIFMFPKLRYKLLSCVQKTFFKSVELSLSRPSLQSTSSKKNQGFWTLIFLLLLQVLEEYFSCSTIKNAFKIFDLVPVSNICLVSS